MDSLPNFLTHGAPLRARFARAGAPLSKLLQDLRQRQINGPIDKYSFQEKAPNSYDLRDH